MTAYPNLHDRETASALLSALAERFARQRPLLAEGAGCHAQAWLSPGQILEGDPFQGVRMIWKPWIQQEAASCGAFLNAAVDAWFTGLLDREEPLRRPRVTTVVATPLGACSIEPGSSPLRFADVCAGADAGQRLPGTFVLECSPDGAAMAPGMVEQGVPAAGMPSPLVIGAVGSDAIASAASRLRRALGMLHEIGIFPADPFLGRILAVAASPSQAGRPRPTVPGLSAVGIEGDMMEILHALVREASSQALTALEVWVPPVVRLVLVPSPFEPGLRPLRSVFAETYADRQVEDALARLAEIRPALAPAVEEVLAPVRARAGLSLLMLRGHQALAPAAAAWVDDALERRPTPGLSIPFRRRAAPGFSPWSRPPPKGAWYEALQGEIARWAPDPSLAAAGGPVRERLLDAATRREEWLFHPCIGALTRPADAHALQRQLQMIAWAGAHGAALATLQVPVACRLWTPMGAYAVEAGRYGARDFADLFRRSPPAGVCVDPWATIVGAPVPEGWSNSAEAEGKEQRVAAVLAAVRAAEAILPDCAKWFESGIRVVVPLATPGAESSGSSADLPGLAFMSIDVPRTTLLELLVHEASHQHLFVAEAEGPLVDPAHVEARYWSPLRKDPRPLRGVLLAFHSLAYTAAFYDSVRRTDLANDSADVIWRDSSARARLCGRTLDAARRHLTAAGLRFLDETCEVAANAEPT